jgi:hypothetical protein
LRTKPKLTDKSYQQGYKIFVEFFFLSAWVLDGRDKHGFSTESCMEDAMEVISMHLEAGKLESPRSFSEGSMDACQKTFQLLILAYSEIQTA